MKKDHFIILGIILLIILFVFIITKDNSKAVVNNNYFKVETPIEKYGAYMSSVRGFPFEIKCNNNQEIKVTVDDGFLIANNEYIEKKENDQYILSCDKTIYWNFIDNKGTAKNIETVTIKFKSSDLSLDEKNFILKRNNKHEYYILK